MLLELQRKRPRSERVRVDTSHLKLKCPVFVISLSKTVMTSTIPVHPPLSRTDPSNKERFPLSQAKHQSMYYEDAKTHTNALKGEQYNNSIET